MLSNTFFAWITLLGLFSFAVLLLFLSLYLFHRKPFQDLKVLFNKQVYRNVWTFITKGIKPLTLNLDEDDYYSPQIILLPQKNVQHCRQEFKKLAEVDKTKITHKEGFISYDSVYMLKKAPHSLSDLNIKVQEMEEALSPLPKFSLLTLHFKDPIKNTFGYGFPQCTIFAGYEEEMITDLWIRKSHLESDTQFDNILTILNNIGKKWGLILVDYHQRKIIDLKNASKVKSYLRKTKEKARSVSEYLIRVKDAEFPNLDPGVDIEHIDKNPFGFKRTGVAWTLAHKDGRTFTLSPEPPGLQVSFDHTTKKDEEKILKYIQAGIQETTIIIPI